jgi:two-component system sensor histidine kinase YesM
MKNKIQFSFKIYPILLFKLVLFLLFLAPKIGFTQTYEQEGNTSKLKEKSSSLEKSLKKGESGNDIAEKYEILAKELFANKDYKEAEEYQQKAIAVYKKNKNKNKLANAIRTLAKIQEAQNKTTQAIESYENASKNSVLTNQSSLNTSDANRLKSNNNADEKSKSIDSKIQNLKKNSSNNKEDIVDAYKQMAEVNIEQKNTTKAIENYNNALSNISNNSPEANNIKSEIADIYAKNNELDQAISIKSAVVQNADSFKNITQQITKRQELAKLYILKNENDKALKLIQEAYNLSLTKGKTIEAKNTLIQLINYYESKKDDKKTLELYENFLLKLESLIKSDSSLIDRKLFELTDSKIKQLEKEKALQDELISKKNSFNYFLISSIIILIILILIIIRYSITVKMKNKKISLQSLRREMNPHFIFNSLNSVNQFIAQNKEIEANNYLTSYSSLMRNIMENSSKDFIPIQKEIEQLKKYLELEHLRFNDKFDYKIILDSNLDFDSLLIPNMIIQPHLENAIWHGLRYKDIKGFLKLSITLSDKFIVINIDDDGIGVKKSQEIKTRNQKIHQSIGLKNINERIKLLNDIYKINISLSIKNKTEEMGTVVELKIPQITNL